MPTKVINLRREKYDVYIGRPGPYGNPYEIGKDGTREEVIEKFRTNFYERLNLDPRWLGMVLKLEGKKLGCFCKPKACHGDVYVEFLEIYRKKGPKL